MKIFDFFVIVAAIFIVAIWLYAGAIVGESIIETKIEQSAIDKGYIQVKVDPNDINETCYTFTSTNFVGYDIIKDSHKKCD